MLRYVSRVEPCRGPFCAPADGHRGDSWPKFEWNGPIDDVLFITCLPGLLKKTASQAPLCFTESLTENTGQVKFALSKGPISFVSRMNGDCGEMPISDKRILESFDGMRP